MSTRAQSWKAATGEPVGAARLAHKVASSAMPKDPDSRSVMLNSAAPGGPRLVFTTADWKVFTDRVKAGEHRLA